MPPARFFRLAERIFAYSGVCAARAQTEYAATQPTQQFQDPQGVRLVDSDAASLMASPLGQYVSIAQV